MKCAHAIVAVASLAALCVSAVAEILPERDAGADAALKAFFGEPGFRVTVPSFLSSNEYPEVVALARGVPSRTFCSGVLIDPTTVLTAAHCVCDPDFSIHFGARVPGDIVRTARHRRIVAGAFCAPTGADDAQLRAARRSRHGRDLALVTLVSSVENTRFDAPATVTAAQPIDNRSRYEYVMITGFGATYPGGEATGQLAGTVIRIVSTQCTEPGAEARYGCRQKKDLVASSAADGRSIAPDACGGDSGGPVWILPHNERRQVAAIVSRRLPGGRCGDGGVHTLVQPGTIARLREQAPL